MGLYLNERDFLVIVGGKVYEVNVGYPTQITSVTRLLSSDKFVLKDSNGVYLIPLPEEDIPSNAILMTDN
jgi:hypothetical protein